MNFVYIHKIIFFFFSLRKELRIKLRQILGFFGATEV